MKTLEQMKAEYKMMKDGAEKQLMALRIQNKAASEWRKTAYK